MRLSDPWTTQSWEAGIGRRLARHHLPSTPAGAEVNHRSLNLRTFLLGIAAGLLFAACSAGPQPQLIELGAPPPAIEGAVSADEAVRLLTETTLACRDAAPVVGLSRTFCQADYTKGPEHAVLTVDFLRDAAGAIHYVEASVIRSENAQAGSEYVGFFVDTVLERLVPDVAIDNTATAWIRNNAEVGGARTIGNLDLRLAPVSPQLRLIVTPTQ